MKCGPTVGWNRVDCLHFHEVKVFSFLSTSGKFFEIVGKALLTTIFCEKERTQNAGTELKSTAFL